MNKTEISKKSLDSNAVFSYLCYITEFVNQKQDLVETVLEETNRVPAFEVLHYRDSSKLYPYSIGSKAAVYTISLLQYFIRENQQYTMNVSDPTTYQILFRNFFNCLVDLKLAVNKPINEKSTVEYALIWNNQELSKQPFLDFIDFYICTLYYKNKGTNKDFFFNHPVIQQISPNTEDKDLLKVVNRSFFKLYKLYKSENNLDSLYQKLIEANTNKN